MSLVTCPQSVHSAMQGFSCQTVYKGMGSRPLEFLSLQANAIIFFNFFFTFGISDRFATS